MLTISNISINRLKWLSPFLAVLLITSMIAATGYQHQKKIEGTPKSEQTPESIFATQSDEVWKETKRILESGDHTRAIGMMQQVLSEGTKKNLKNTSAYCEQLRRLAKLFALSGKTDEALNALFEAEAIASAIGNLNEQHGATAAITSIYYQAGDYVNACKYSQALLAHCYNMQPLDSTKVCKAHYYLGSSYWGLEQRDSCTTHYHHALAYWAMDDKGIRPQLSAMYEVLGTYFWERNEDAEATIYFRKAAEIQMELNPSNHDGLNLTDGNAALESYYNEKLLREKTLGASNPYTVGCNNYIAKALLLSGNNEKALDVCNEAISAYCKTVKSDSAFDNFFDVNSASNYSLLFDLLFLRGKILFRMAANGNDTALAALLENNKKADQTIDALRNRIRNDASAIFWGERVIPFYEFAILSLLNNDGDVALEQREAAFQYAEKSRAYLLNKAMALHNNQQIAGVPQVVTDSLHLLKSQLRQLEFYTQSIATKCDVDEAKKLELCYSQTRLANLALEQYIAVIKNTYPQYHQLMFATSTIGLADVQSELATGELLLQFFAGDTALIVFAISKNEMHTEVIGNYKILQKQIEALLAQVRMTAEVEIIADNFAQSAHVLFLNLVQPFLNEDVKSIRIVADGKLAYLPFEVLVTDVGQSASTYASLNYLIKKMPVSYLFSASQLKQEAQHNEGSYIGFAPVYASAIDTTAALRGQSMATLRYNVKEVETLHQTFGGEIFSSATLSEADFGQHANDASVLHLAMHTQLEEDDPLTSGFIFSQDSVGENDGVLQLHEMYALQLNAQLAILSSCNTATGRTLRGEGVMSLARAFTYAGCPAVATTLWSCDDESTFSIVSAFGGHWKNGIEKHKALQSAKLEYLNSTDEVHAHPFYWAGMVLCGDTAKYNASNAIWWWCAGGALALMLLLFLWKRFR
ncbi:MAG: CHAT domain-containing protein [Flavobacteriales bacterium]